MTDLPLPSFPAHAAYRSFYLGQIRQQVEKTEVASLLVGVGISDDDFRLYWSTRPPAYGHHQGFCWVEFQTRKLAVLAWFRLDGLHKWGRMLVVRPVTTIGALNPSLDDLNAARSQQPAGSANRLLQPGPRRPRGNLHHIPVQMTQRITKNREPTSRSVVQTRSKSSKHKASTGRRTGDAAEGSGAKADDTSHKIAHMTGHKPPAQAEKDIWSDGSLRETIQRNADKVGPGWGGYAPFQTEPGRGPIDPSEVQALNWHDPTPFRYIDVDGDIVLHVSASLANKKEERTESLWFVLAKASGEMTDKELRKEKTLPSPRDVGL